MGLLLLSVFLNRVSDGFEKFRSVKKCAKASGREMNF